MASSTALAPVKSIDHLVREGLVLGPLQALGELQNVQEEQLKTEWNALHIQMVKYGR